MEKKRALVLGGGGLKGAYTAGVTATLCRELGKDYFDSIYASSVGVYMAAFYASNQPEIIENTWRNLVTGNQLVNFGNIFRKKKVLDLEYLADIFKNEKSHLDLERISQGDMKLKFTLTDFLTKNPVYVSPTKENIFEIMMASSAAPIVHGPFEFEGIKYIDGAMSDPLPVSKALEDGCDEIVAVLNGPLQRKGIKKVVNESFWKLFPSYSYLDKKKNVKKILCENKKIKIILPSEELPLFHHMDANKKRVNASIDLGIKHAKDFLRRQASKTNVVDALRYE